MRSCLRRVGWLDRAAVAAVLAACASVATWAATKGPDAGGYTASDTAFFSFIDVSGSGGGAGVLAGTDDGLAALTMPFAFKFYGTSYTSVCVSSNGALYFVPSASACSGLSDFANTDLSAEAIPGNLPALLPLWSDLTFEVAGGGGVFYQAIGAPGARRFIVQWSNAYPQGSPNPVTFEAILSEGTNNILFQYKTVKLGDGNRARNGAQATVGIRNAGAPTNLQQIAWSFNAPVIAESSALSFSPAATGCATDVGASALVTRAGFIFNPVTQRFTQSVKLTNTSASPIAGPLSLVIDGLRSNATLFAPAGGTSCTTPAGQPFVTASTAPLAAGASVSVTLQFTNPTKTGIAYTTRVLAGTGTR